MAEMEHGTEGALNVYEGDLGARIWSTVEKADSISKGAFAVMVHGADHFGVLRVVTTGRLVTIEFHQRCDGVAVEFEVIPRR